MVTATGRLGRFSKSCGNLRNGCVDRHRDMRNPPNSLAEYADMDDEPSCAASRFSQAASSGCYPLCHHHHHHQQQAVGQKEMECPSFEDDRLSAHIRDNELHSIMDSILSAPRSWNVGRLSFLLLVFVTCTDLAYKFHVDAEMHRAVDNANRDYYDALSTEVIRPPFLTKSHHHHGAPDRPSLGLGSAAISSITDALSPILPFTGGLDLRRTEYWDTSRNWLENLSTVVRETYEAFANAKQSDDHKLSSPLEVAQTNRGGGQVPKKVAAKLSTKKSKSSHELVLSASTPFVSLETIGDLTLVDLATVFDYAVQSTREGFDEAKFLRGVPDKVKSVSEAMDASTSKARGGKDVRPVKVPADDDTTGQIDAFNFCAAMRIFAEWRILRQVPEGYKGYAVGMNLGHKDVVQNVAKIEHAAHAWIEHQRELIESGCDIGDDCPTQVQSPTLRDIMNHEIEMDVHGNDKLPRLKDPSGAMGILWVRRQLQYQTEIFGNIRNVPQRFPTTKDAISAAYNDVYGKFHGWAVQKIFNYSFQAAPDADEILKTMNPQHLEEVMEVALRMTTATADDMSDGFLEEGVAQRQNENFFQKVGSEVDKFVHSIGQVFGGRTDPRKIKVRGGASLEHVGSEALQEDAMEEFISQEVWKDANDQILEYLGVVQPLLKHLAGVFQELNMDDPTKV